MNQIKRIILVVTAVILALLYYGSTLIGGKFDEVKTSLSSLEQKIQAVEAKLDTLEKNEVARVKDELSRMNAYADAMQKKLAD